MVYVGWLMGSTAGIPFVGSQTNSDITFRTNNSEKVRLTAAGNMGIGTAAPGAKLEVAGQVKITGGSPGAGKVLTSDAAGLASWEGASNDAYFTNLNAISIA